MFKSFGQKPNNKKYKSVNLWNREFDVVSEGLDEAQVSKFIEELISENNDSGVPADALKALMDRAVDDAEQIVADIKTEAQNEAVRIIDEAKLGADEIKKKEEILIEKQAEEIISLLEKSTKKSGADAKQKIQQLLMQVKREVESEVRKEYKEAHSKLLYSLLGASDVDIKEIKLPDKSEIEVSSDIIEIEKEEIKEEQPVKKDESIQKIEAAEQETEKKEKAKPTKAEEKKVKNEEKKAREEAKLAEKEAQRIVKEQKKIEAEAAKKAKKEAKQKEEKLPLMDRINALRERLNERLSQPIGGNTVTPAMRPRPANVHKEGTVVQEAEEEIAPQEVPEQQSEDKSKKLMDMIFEADIPGSDEQEEAAISVEEEKPVESEIVEDIKEETQHEEEAVVEKGIEEVEPAKAEQEEQAEAEEEEPAIIAEEKATDITEEKEDEPSTEVLKQDEGVLYTGDVEMSIEVPVNLVAVSKLYNFLQSTPDLKVLYTKGSWDKATIIMVSLDKPLPLLDMISRVPGIKITARSSNADSEIKGASASLLGTDKDGLKKISIILTEG